MRKSLLPILACPMCRTSLTLSITREDAREVLDGSLECSSCHERYPIKDGIPNLLPPDLREA